MMKEENKTTTNFIPIHPVDVIRTDGDITSIIFLSNAAHTSIVMGMMYASSNSTRTFDPRIIVRLEDIFDDAPIESTSDVIENTAIIRGDDHITLMVSAATITNEINYELFAVKAAQDDDSTMDIERWCSSKFPIVKLQFRYIIDLYELIKFLCKTDKRVLISEIFKYQTHPSYIDDKSFYSIPTEDIDEKVYTFCENPSEPARTFLPIKGSELGQLRAITKEYTFKKAFILAISIDDALRTCPDISSGYLTAPETLSTGYVELPIYIFNTTKKKLIGKFLPVGDGTSKLISDGKEVALILAKYMIPKRELFELFKSKSTPDPTEDVTSKEDVETAVNRDPKYDPYNIIHTFMDHYEMVDENQIKPGMMMLRFAGIINDHIIFESEMTDQLNQGMLTELFSAPHIVFAKEIEEFRHMTNLMRSEFTDHLSLVSIPNIDFPTKPSTYPYHISEMLKVIGDVRISPSDGVYDLYLDQEHEICEDIQNNYTQICISKEFITLLENAVSHYFHIMTADPLTVYKSVMRYFKNTYAIKNEMSGMPTNSAVGLVYSGIINDYIIFHSVITAEKRYVSLVDPYFVVVLAKSIKACYTETGDDILTLLEIPLVTIDQLDDIRVYHKSTDTVMKVESCYIEEVGLVHVTDGIINNILLKNDHTKHKFVGKIDPATIYKDTMELKDQPVYLSSKHMSDIGENLKSLLHVSDDEMPVDKKETNASPFVQNVLDYVISRYTIDTNEMHHLNMRYTSMYALGKTFCLVFENGITDILNKACADNNQTFFMVIDVAKLLNHVNFHKMKRANGSGYPVIDYFYIIESRDLTDGFEHLAPIRLRTVYDANSAEISCMEVFLSAMMRLDIQRNVMNKVIQTYNGKRYYLRLTDDCVDALKSDLCFAAAELESGGDTI